jgi:hypothetical protein
VNISGRHNPHVYYALRQLDDDPFSSRRTILTGSILISLSAVSGAPRDATVRSCILSCGALRIQRLEGSRPHGRLCTLNRSERVQRDQEETELVSIRLPDGRMGRRGGSLRSDVKGEETGIQ